MQQAVPYLLHRRSVSWDAYHWQKFLDLTPYPVLWMDFSQNIKLVSKKEAQSARYSGKQHTLHDTLIQYPESDTPGSDKISKKKYTYLYHISDDTNHDSTLTDYILEDTIKLLPELIKDGHLIIRSDNCSTQFKSKYTFSNMVRMAEKYGIQITWVFGEPGHGRGLVDAMAWFGVKGPIRKAIICNDKWFPTADKMVADLSQLFSNDPSKVYRLVDETATAAIRRKKRQELPMKGCRAAHVIIAQKDGSLLMKSEVTKDLINTSTVVTPTAQEVLELTEVAENVTDDITETEYEQGSEIQPDTASASSPSLDTMGKYDHIQVGTFVAIRATRLSYELFHVMKVLEKGVADYDMKDPANEHYVLCQDPFVIGKWHSFQTEDTKFAYYKEAARVENTLINVHEIFYTDLQISDGKLDINDYRMLCCNT